MSDVTEQRHLLSTALASFLDGGDQQLLGVPGHVAASWRRSASNGVHPNRIANEYFTELDVDSRLVRCALPVIDQLAEQLSAIPMCVALTDNRARILSRRDSSSPIGRVLDRVQFAQGFGYAEGSVGTNGVGTVLEFGESVHIVGAEHFVDSLHAFACAGAPIRDPFTGRIEGVVDISCLSRHSTPIMHSLVRSAARRIEYNLRLDRNLAQQALFDAFSGLDQRSRQAVLAVGPQMIMANTLAQTSLEPGDLDALRNHMRFVTLRRRAVDDRVALPSGATVRLRGSLVTVGGDVAGMVGAISVVPDVDGVAPAMPRSGEPGRPVSPPRLPTVLDGCPAWSTAARTVESALRVDAAMLVLGEPGSGRFTLLSELDGHVHDGRSVVALTAEEIDAAPAATAARLRHPGPDPALYVLRDIDRLSASTARGLADALGRDAQVGGGSPVQPGPGQEGRRTGGARAALAASAADASLVDERLLAVFTASAAVPPLRHRGADLATLATALLRDLAPHRDVRLSRDALRLLEGYRWPGNVSELRETLAAALRRRPVGVIDTRDLPQFCQSAPRSRLRPVDEVERDAIVRALRDVGGNRKAAAAALGVARSTLYRKIRQYGITA